MRVGKCRPRHRVYAAHVSADPRTRPGTAASDRRAVHPPPVLRQPQDGDPPAHTGPSGEPQAGAAADAHAGPGGDGRSGNTSIWMNLTNGWLLKKRPNVATISLPWQAKNVNYRREFTAIFGLDRL